ncbi:MAG: hypothetical protein IPL59_10345 [Candidatus Competibacteraceae bacterium]|nr:hypothetical protein [Candidatus Competibacteraceae bacterium]
MNPAPPVLAIGAPHTADTGGSPLTSAHEAAGGSLYFLDEVRVLTATPRGPDHGEPAVNRPEAARPGLSPSRV